jgi:starch synthase
MKVLIASSEAVPFAKTGGLADVIGSLVKELRALGIDARLVMPLYRGIKSRLKPRPTPHTLSVPVGSRRYGGRLYSHEDSAYFIECREFFDRKEIYGTPEGEYEDNAFRFIFFSKAVLDSCRLLGFIPDVMHCNDWQTGLVPLYMKTVSRESFRATASLLTIHNLGYQGIFPPSAMTLTGLPADMFNPDELEFHGQVNLLKAGIVSADAISTVSGTYARQMMEEEYGFGLNGAIKKRAGDLYGILNGIDAATWDPENDALTPAGFGPGNMAGKEAGKSRLAKTCSFKDRKAPVAGMVGRLASQKGMEIFLDAAERIFSLGVNVVVLGKGEEGLQKRFREAARKHPANFFVHMGYDEGLAHLIYSGSDMFLIPSRYEPCGLTQMIAMRYGAVPVARATGGILDTVEDYDHLRDKGTGFLFSGYDSSAFLECLKRALCVYSGNGKWGRIVAEGMKKDFSWKKSAGKYVELYTRLVKKAKA